MLFLYGYYAIEICDFIGPRKLPFCCKIMDFFRNSKNGKDTTKVLHSEYVVFMWIQIFNCGQNMDWIFNFVNVAIYGYIFWKVFDINCQLWFSKSFTWVFKPKYVELMWILSREHVWLSEKNWKGLNNAILLHNYGSTINSNYIDTQERNATAQIRGCFVDPCIYLLSKCGLFIWFAIFSAWLYPYFSNI